MEFSKNLLHWENNQNQNTPKLCSILSQDAENFALDNTSKITWQKIQKQNVGVGSNLRAFRHLQVIGNIPLSSNFKLLEPYMALAGL